MYHCQDPGAGIREACQSVAGLGLVTQVVLSNRDNGTVLRMNEIVLLVYRLCPPDKERPRRTNTDFVNHQNEAQ